MIQMQYIGSKNVIYIDGSYSVKKSHKGCRFFYKISTEYKCPIDFIQQVNKQ